MSKSYQEPPLSFLVLDFKKKDETKLCLNSIRNRVKFSEYKIIYLHNGPDEDYPYQFFKDGLVDQIIQTKANNGLGIGTRDLFAASFSPFSIYWQNDQIMGRDFSAEEFTKLASILNGLMDEKTVKYLAQKKKIQSVSLAGAVCGEDIYSERAHIVRTNFYKNAESQMQSQFVDLGWAGAGPYHDGMWREEIFQKLYKQDSFVHMTEWPILAIDNGKRAIRENPDGSQWLHFPDTKGLTLLKGPVKERHVYPKFTDLEWEDVIKTQTWPEGKVPSNEVKDSFHVWN